MTTIILSTIRNFRSRSLYIVLTDIISDICGRSKTFAIACFIVATWLITGPIFNYSDTWQLVINTGTTIITFLMMFILQNSHNRDMKDLHNKIDKLLEKDKTEPL